MPASGFRNYTTGDLTNVGGSGVYWSSAASAADNANAGYLHADASSVRPLHGNPRAFGFSVRCVQHLQAAF